MKDGLASQVGLIVILISKLTALGTREKWINVPCGITIRTKDVGLCDAIQSNLHINTDTLQKASAMCDCVPKVLGLIKEGAFSQISADSGVSTATSGLLGMFAQLQKVLFDIM